MSEEVKHLKSYKFDERISEELHELLRGVLIGKKIMLEIEFIGTKLVKIDVME